MQVGFRAKRSCVHAITSVTDFMRKEMNKKTLVKLVFGDEESIRFVGSYGTDEQIVLVRI